MTYTKRFYSRKSIRLREYDYSQQGLYFITICTQNRSCLFGSIDHGSIMLYDSGKMIENQWLQMPQRFPNIVLHEYIIMPNHIHVILEIVPTVGATLVVALDNKNVVALDNKGMITHNNKTMITHENTNCNHNTNINTHDNKTMVINESMNPHGNAHKNIFTQNQKYQPDQLWQPHINQLGQPQGIAPTITIGDIIGAFKSITTHEYIRGVTNKHWKPFDGKLWQRNYYEHIIRNEQSYLRIVEYIIQNPNKWKDDRFYF
ncbi:MAG TPA: hypothetical protein PLS12_07890 [Bacteroidales bacterium]|nr:hypothetical protein [Bacteroidales bacterium]